MHELQVTGIVLAAGAGSRAGGPKALRVDAEGVPWLERAVSFLRESGCKGITVVLGAGAEEARVLVPSHASVIVNADWASGMASSLQAGLRAAAGAAVLITLVDLPDLPASVGRRMLEGGVGRGVLRQATFGGRPGHPVLIGADHWEAVIAEASGDRGARGYLVRNGVTEVECSDLASGVDVDNAP